MIDVLVRASLGRRVFVVPQGFSVYLTTVVRISNMFNKRFWPWFLDFGVFPWGVTLVSSSKTLVICSDNVNWCQFLQKLWFMKKRGQRRRGF